MARKLAADLDLALAILLPLLYTILLYVLVRPHSDTGLFRSAFDCTSIKHGHDGATAYQARCDI